MSRRCWTGRWNESREAGRIPAKSSPRQTDRLHAILEDLLALAPRGTGGRRAGQNVLGRDRCGACSKRPLPTAPEGGGKEQVRIELACPAELAASMNASLLEQAVVNLIENAIAYSPARASRWKSGAWRDERDIGSASATTAVESSREHLPRIFERFYRVDKARSRELRRHRAGLAIVSTSSNSTAAEPPCQERPGQGSTFSIFLPK